MSSGDDPGGLARGECARGRQSGGNAASGCWFQARSHGRTARSDTQCPCGGLDGRGGGNEPRPSGFCRTQLSEGVLTDLPHVGEIRALRGEIVVGWAFRPERPDERVVVEILCDGYPVTLATADMFEA